MLFLIVLTGCDTLEPFLHEVQVPVSQVSFSGAVLDSAFDFKTPFTGGSMEWTDASGDLLGVGVEVDPVGSPGYWSVVLPADADYALRADGDGAGADAYPALFTGVAPAGAGLWFTGAVFGWPAAIIDPMLSDTAAQLGLSLEPLSEGQLAQLWGSVYPDQVEDFDPARLSVIDGDGVLAPVGAWRIGADGSWSAVSEPPVDYFMAYNLAPGAVTVIYSADGGDVETTYPDVRGGDVVTPWYYRVY